MKLRAYDFNAKRWPGRPTVEAEVVGEDPKPFGGPFFTANDDGTTTLSWHLPKAMVEMDLEPYELATLADSAMTQLGFGPKD